MRTAETEMSEERIASAQFVSIGAGEMSNRDCTLTGAERCTVAGPGLNLSTNYRARITDREGS